LRSSPLTSRLRFKSARDAEAHLLSFVNYERIIDYRPTSRTHDLRAFEARLRTAGWRPGAVPTVHVGGTNGKGTVAHLIERVLRAGGVRTGLYTSPHLQDMRERIRVDGLPIGARVFCRGVERLAGVFAARSGTGFRTTFEHLTALALLEFQERRVDRAILEVGLGGKLDATNVIPAGPVVLTPVSLDHQHVLGDTVKAIAADKARIVKPGGRVFLLEQPPEAEAAIRARARRVGVEVTPVASAVRVDPVAGKRDGVFRIRGKREYGVVRTRLLGLHQRSNVAAAVAVAEALLPAARCRAAVGRGLTGAVVSGRLQRLRWRGLRVVLDGGHNPGAARAVAAALERAYAGARIVAVVGMASDKNHREYLDELRPRVREFVFTRAQNPRAAPPGVLRAALGEGTTAPSVRAALDRAAQTTPDVLLVSGSFLIVGEALSVMRRRARR